MRRMLWRRRIPIACSAFMAWLLFLLGKIAPGSFFEGPWEVLFGISLWAGGTAFLFLMDGNDSD
jgi:hypothetical protein